MLGYSQQFAFDYVRGRSPFLFPSFPFLSLRNDPSSIHSIVHVVRVMEKQRKKGFTTTTKTQYFFKTRILSREIESSPIICHILFFALDHNIDIMMYHLLHFLFTISILQVVAGELDQLAKVFDNVLDAETAAWLHQECLQVERDGKDIGFQFPLDEPAKYTPVEQFLNKLLLELYPRGDDNDPPSYFVEYWTRSKWMLIMSHADMDEAHHEKLLLSGATGFGGNLRHPEIGHVLYLKVGSNVRGPTVVWNVTRGGDFMDGQDTEMVIVPAVEGRLTRFQGDKLHGVPRPGDVYWTIQQDGNQHEPEELWMRSVLLFNLWPVKKGKPGIVISEAKEQEAVPISQSCNSIQDWQVVESILLDSDPSEEARNKFKMPLMGDVERRGTDKIVAKLETQSNVKAAMMEESKVTTSTVTGERKKAWFSFMGIEF